MSDIRPGGGLAHHRTLRRLFDVRDGAWWFFVAATGLATVALMIAASRQWFLQDDWGYLIWRDDLAERGGRLRGGTVGQYMEPHNGHWVAVPVLIYYANRALFGLSSYWPFVAPWLVFHLMSVWLVRAVAIRAGVTAWTASVLCCILLVFGSAGEYLVFAPVMSWTIGLSALFAQLLLIDHDGPLGRRELAASAIGLIGMMSSGFGIIFAAAVAIALSVRRRWRALIVVLLPQVLAFVGWWVVYGQDQAADAAPGERSITSVTEYAVVGITSAFDALTGAPATSGVVMLSTGMFGLALLTDVRRSAAVWGLGATAVLLYLGLGVQRVGFGVEQARAARYTIVGAMLLLPAVGLAVDRLRRWGRPALAFAYAFAVVATFVNLGRLDTSTKARGELADQHRAIFEVVAGSPDFDSFQPAWLLGQASGIPVGSVPWLVSNGMIEPRPAADDGERALLAAIPRIDG